MKNIWLDQHEEKNKKPIMGIGLLGNTHITFSSKKRWTFEGTDEKGNVIFPENFIKLSSRPQAELNKEETEIDFLCTKNWAGSFSAVRTFASTTPAEGCSLQWIPGPVCESITTAFFENINRLTLGLSTVFNIMVGAKTREFIGTLKLYDSLGNVIETWTLGDCHVGEANFGDVDSSSLDPALEIKFLYSKLNYQIGAKDVK